MSKAILVLENMPKRCVDCPFCYNGELFPAGEPKTFLYKQLYRCLVEPRDVEYSYLPNILTEKAEWCPLQLQEQFEESLRKE